MAEQFIQEFVANYPCDVCRGKLIVDTPEAEETHRDWVHRNHVRFNQERGLPEPQPLPVNIGTDVGSSNITTGCVGCPVTGATTNSSVAVETSTDVPDVPVVTSTDAPVITANTSNADVPVAPASTDDVATAPIPSN